MAKQEPNYYQILNINASSSIEEIKKAYRLLAFQYHPDIAGDSDLKTEQFRLVQEAYITLSDPERRKLYDSRNPAFSKPSKEVSLPSIEADILKLQSYLKNTPAIKLNYDNIHFELERILTPRMINFLMNCMDSASVDWVVVNLNMIAYCLPYKFMQHHQAKFTGLTNNTIIILYLEQSLQKRKRLMVWGWLKFVLVIILAIAICIAIAFSL
jgi:hypothetical protein